jgi:uncharacterized protein YutE (UPF0331/DUF86 family)
MESWEKFLNPKELRGSLLGTSMYIAAYEICRESIIDKLRSFYSDYWDKDGAHPGSDYESKVLALAKSPLQATLLWFQDRGAISETDLETFSKARKLRNEIAHDLPEFLSSPNREINQRTFEGLLEVTHKIGVWWVINVEVATDPDNYDEQIDESGVKTGTLLLIQMMMDIAFGNEPEEGYYYNAFKNQKNS